MVEERIIRRSPPPLVRYAVLAVSLAFSEPAAAQENLTELKLSTWFPPAHQLTAAFESWAKSIERVSKGTLKFRFSPAQALGKARDHYDMLRDGTADAVPVNPLFQQGRFWVLEAAALPLLVGNERGGTAALHEWYRGFAGKEMREAHFCLAFVHEPGALHSRKKIAVPADLRGVKALTPNTIIANFVSSLGGTNIQHALADARQMLERGSGDTIALPWRSVAQFKIERARFHLDIPLYTTPLALVLSRASYGRLSEQQREVIDAHCNGEWAQKFADQWSNGDTAARAELANKAGHELHRPSPAQMEQWLKAAVAGTQQWSGQAKKAGWNPAEVLSELKTALSRHGAAVP